MAFIAAAASRSQNCASDRTFSKRDGPDRNSKTCHTCKLSSKASCKRHTWGWSKFRWSPMCCSSSRKKGTCLVRTALITRPELFALSLPLKNRQMVIRSPDCSPFIVPTCKQVCQSTAYLSCRLSVGNEKGTTNESEKRGREELLRRILNDPDLVRLRACDRGESPPSGTLRMLAEYLEDTEPGPAMPNVMRISLTALRSSWFSAFTRTNSLSVISRRLSSSCFECSCVMRMFIKCWYSGDLFRAPSCWR
mmetsp:Transcript_19831/g.46327  ORF Transcript_19831/g.46327 Transcript_19831/m.46327 type:complete len:250 (+) Transcript_19831:1189-1938(+)